MSDKNKQKARATSPWALLKLRGKQAQPSDSEQERRQANSSMARRIHGFSNFAAADWFTYRCDRPLQTAA